MPNHAFTHNSSTRSPVKRYGVWKGAEEGQQDTDHLQALQTHTRYTHEHKRHEHRATKLSAFWANGCTIEEDDGDDDDDDDDDDER